MEVPICLELAFCDDEISVHNECMKKSIAVLLASILCITLFAPAVSAANRVPEMEIEVALRPDGSAYITQFWTTDTYGLCFDVRRIQT